MIGTYGRLSFGANISDVSIFCRLIFWTVVLIWMFSNIYLHDYFLVHNKKEILFKTMLVIFVSLLLFGIFDPFLEDLAQSSVWKSIRRDWLRS